MDKKESPTTTSTYTATTCISTTCEALTTHNSQLTTAAKPPHSCNSWTKKKAPPLPQPTPQLPVSQPLAIALTTHNSQLAGTAHRSRLTQVLASLSTTCASRQVAGACQSAAVGSVAEPTTPLHNYSPPRRNHLHLNHLRSTHNSLLTTHNCGEAACPRSR